MIRVVPDPTDDPEIVHRLARLGWMEGSPVPRLTRLAAYGVLRRGDRVLLCRVSPGNIGEGIWTLPGGGLVASAAQDAAAPQSESSPDASSR